MRRIGGVVVVLALALSGCSWDTVEDVANRGCATHGGTESIDGFTNVVICRDGWVAE